MFYIVNKGRLIILHLYSIPAVIRPSFSDEKVASRVGDNLVVLYYLSASDIWTDTTAYIFYLTLSDICTYNSLFFCKSCCFCIMLFLQP